MAEAEAPAEGRWELDGKLSHSLTPHTRALHLHALHACAGALLDTGNGGRGGETGRARERKLRGAKLLSMRVLVDMGAGSCSLLPAREHVGFCVQTLHSHGA
jgi:hypothetical protein